MCVLYLWFAIVLACYLGSEIILMANKRMAKRQKIIERKIRVSEELRHEREYAEVQKILQEFYI